MTKTKPTKKQLNFFLPEDSEADFRAQAQKAGFGSRLTPYFLRLLEASHGDLKTIRNLIVQAHNEDPDCFQVPAQREYARELILLLAEILDED